MSGLFHLLVLKRSGGKGAGVFFPGAGGEIAGIDERGLVKGNGGRRGAWEGRVAWGRGAWGGALGLYSGVGGCWRCFEVMTSFFGWRWIEVG